MGYAEYRDTITRMCPFYGMSLCRLTVGQIRALHRLGRSVDEAYAIACDVHSGVDFGNALVACVNAESKVL